MKTRRTSAEPPKITAGVRTRRTARIGSPSSRTQNDTQLDENVTAQSVVLTTEKVDEPPPKSRLGIFYFIHKYPNFFSWPKGFFEGCMDSR